LAGFIWTFVDSKRNPVPQEYNNLYYWLRVIVRYLAGIGIIGFGFTKLLPIQMPYLLSDCLIQISVTSPLS
jgi:hypothetical protein